MTCQEIADFLMLYLDDELPAVTRSAFEGHLAVCEACRDYLRTYSQAVKLGKDAFAHAKDDPAPESLVAAIRAARQSSR
ncbi:MAG: zf-HC2 domain-containing protein [Phycisphaeraceae bacterium]|nr:zf-HC2 domain-containing protein [Phycisphaeraceae bacterium]